MRKIKCYYFNVLWRHYSQYLIFYTLKSSVNKKLSKQSNNIKFTNHNSYLLVPIRLLFFKILFVSTFFLIIVIKFNQIMIDSCKKSKNYDNLLDIRIYLQKKILNLKDYLKPI